MEEIEVDKLRDIIIVEKSNGNDILKGSKLFCGCCGKPLGELKKKLTFPFNHDVLLGSIKNASCSIGAFGDGLTHKTCRHTMFSFRKEWGFITLENYLKQFY